jgi:hypothetical protein
VSSGRVVVRRHLSPFATPADETPDGVGLAVGVGGVSPSHVVVRRHLSPFDDTG